MSFNLKDEVERSRVDGIERQVKIFSAIRHRLGLLIELLFRIELSDKEDKLAGFGYNLQSVWNFFPGAAIGHHNA